MTMMSEIKHVCKELKAKNFFFSCAKSITFSIILINNRYFNLRKRERARERKDMMAGCGRGGRELSVKMTFNSV